MKKALAAVWEAIRRQLVSRKSQHALAGVVGVYLTQTLGTRYGMTPEQITQLSGAIVALAMSLIGGTALEDAGEKSARIYEVPEAAEVLPGKP